MRTAAAVACAIAAFFPAAVAQAEPCHLATYGVLPVSWAGARATIPVTVNDKPTFAMLDTGATDTVFFRNRSHDLSLTLEPSTLAFTGLSGYSQAFITNVRKLTIGNFGADNLNFFVVDQELGESEKNISLILGMDVMHSADTEYDLANNQVKMFKTTGDCGSKAMVYWADDWVQVDLIRSSSGIQQIRIPVTLNGKEIEAIIDTGAPVSFVLRSAAERASASM